MKISNPLPPLHRTVPMATKQGLLIVDIQNDYFDGGANPLVGSMEASENAKLLLEHFRSKKMPVFIVQHINKPDAPFFRPNTPGAAIHENVAPLEGDLMIEKHYPNSFRGTGLVDELWREEVKSLVICGMMTHMCIDATTRAAKDLGFECTVIGDACATLDLEYDGKKVAASEVHAAFLAALSCFYADVKTTNAFLNGQ